MNSDTFATPRTRMSTIREGDVMFNESRKIVLTSLFVGAVAIAAYVSQSGKSWLSPDELGLDRDNASAHYTRGDMVTGSVSSGPVVASSDSAAAIAGKLQAARDSLQRNDLVTAQAQLDAVRSAHQDNDQVLALQREVEARAKQTQHAQAAVHVEKPVRQGAKPARFSSLSSLSSGKSAKTGHAHENHLATREHSNRASSSYAKDRRASETAATAVSAASMSSGRASGVGAPAVASSPSSVPAEVKAVSNAASAPAASPPTQSTQSTSTTPSSPQAKLTEQAAPVQPAESAESAESTPQPAAGTLSKSDGGAETRGQVRSEIARARADGGLPAFGNPDPAGPGGAPSRTGAPRP